MIKTVFIIFAFIISLSSTQAQKSSEPVVVPVGEKGLDTLRARSLGNVLVVNLWATWCVPCIQEFPELLKLRREYGSRGLDVVFISIDDDLKAKQKVLAFLKKMKASGTFYIKQTEDDELFINAINPKWSGGLPTTLVYDSSGRLAEMVVEQMNFFELEKIVQPLLRY